MTNKEFSKLNIPKGETITVEMVTREGTKYAVMGTFMKDEPSGIMIAGYGICPYDAITLVEVS
jgi:hypothetical protein